MEYQSQLLYIFFLESRTQNALEAPNKRRLFRVFASSSRKMMVARLSFKSLGLL